MRLLRSFVRGLSVLWSEDFVEFLGELTALYAVFGAVIVAAVGLVWAFATTIEKLQ